MQQVFLGAPNNYSLQLFIAMPLILLTFIETKHSHPMISSCNKTHFNAFLFPSKNYKFNLCCYILPFLRDSLTDSVLCRQSHGPILKFDNGFISMILSIWCVVCSLSSLQKQISNFFEGLTYFAKWLTGALFCLLFLSSV